MFATRLPDESFVSHSTAARLIAAPLPSRLARMSRMHFTVEAPARAPHAAGLIWHSRRVAPGDIVIDPDGLRRSSPERIVCEMATVLRLDDLVALIDYVIHHSAPLTSVEEIARRLEFGDRITRARTLRVALALADPRSESRPESKLRVLLTMAGILGWHANYEVVDSATGDRFRIDLALPEVKVGLEYQGEHHWTVAQRRRDMTRRARLEADGWRIMEINADDLANPVELVARVQRFLAA
jgi:very-short-patch-repair endonuclease